MKTLLDLPIPTDEKLVYLALAVLQLTKYPDKAQPFPASDEEISEVAIKIMDVAIKRLTERGFNVTQASGAKV